MNREEYLSLSKSEQEEFWRKFWQREIPQESFIPELGVLELTLLLNPDIISGSEVNNKK